jgi:hypothetical protein
MPWICWRKTMNTTRHILVATLLVGLSSELFAFGGHPDDVVTPDQAMSGLRRSVREARRELETLQTAARMLQAASDACLTARGNQDVCGQVERAQRRYDAQKDIYQGRASKMEPWAARVSELVKKEMATDCKSGFLNTWVPYRSSNCTKNQARYQGMEAENKQLVGALNREASEAAQSVETSVVRAQEARQAAVQRAAQEEEEARKAAEVMRAARAAEAKAQAEALAEAKERQRILANRRRAEAARLAEIDRQLEQERQEERERNQRQERDGARTFEGAKVQVAAYSRGMLNRQWKSEKLKKLSRQWALEHFLGVSTEDELEALKIRAKELGRPHVLEVAARIKKAEVLAQRTRDGWYDVGDNLLQNSWNRFVAGHERSEFGDNQSVQTAFGAESPEFVSYIRLQTGKPATFSGTAAQPGWIESWKPDGSADDPSEKPLVSIAVAPVGPVKLPKGKRISGMSGVPPLGSCGPMGLPCQEQDFETVARFTPETDRVATVTVPLDSKLPVLKPESKKTAPDPVMEGDLDEGGQDTGWKRIRIKKNQTLGELGVTIRRRISKDKRPPLWGDDGIVDLLYQANMGHIKDRDVLKVGDIVLVPTDAWFESSP